MKAREGKNGEFQTRCTGDMFCPYCGQSQSDPEEISKDYGETRCERCERIFTYERNVIIEYSTGKKDL